MLIDILFLVAGLVMLFIGGEGLVRGSVSLAQRFGLSTLLVSLVIIGFGTSTPELLVSVKAALQGASDIALGNVIGSNICNILLILGVAATLNRVDCDAVSIRRDSMAVVAASLLIASFSFLPLLGFMSGFVMMGLLIGYLAYSYMKDKADAGVAEDQDGVKKSSLPIDIGFVVGGLGLLMWGADLLVNGATSLAREAGISEAVIGLTLVAVGTSLPELATAVVAAYRKQADVVIGNILGSNLFNILGILGITAMITPVPFTGQIAAFDVWIMLIVAIILYGLIRFNRNLDRNTGALFLCAYFLYVSYLFVDH